MDKRKKKTSAKRLCETLWTLQQLRRFRFYKTVLFLIPLSSESQYRQVRNTK